jgi:MSHA biogenesis protein MshN
MSLINQMLKDLEQRGARDTDVMVADVGKSITTKLDVATTPQPNQLLLIKIGSVLVLLAGGVYLWMQSAQALSHNTDMVKAITSIIKPQSIIADNHSVADTKLVKLDIVAPITNEPAMVESIPLFETELKYQTIAIQSQPNKTVNVIANLMPETTVLKPVALVQPKEPVRPAQSAEPTSPVTYEKSVATEHIAAKSSIKTNGDNNTSINKQIRPEQKSGNYYRQALSNLQQGRVAEAQANLALALEANPANQDARQTLAGLLLDNKRNDEARATLAAGLAIAPEQSDFRMALARLQVETGDSAGALNNLEQGLTYAKGNADYQGFLATLLQRAERHEEAISHYMTALSINSASSSALIGMGISLQAVGRLESAQDAFMRAQTSTALSPELSLFVEQQLKKINQRVHNTNNK